MKNFIIFLICCLFCYQSVFAGMIIREIGVNNPASWDLLDEDCSDISDWTDGDKGTGVSEVSPAGQFRMDSNLSAANDDYAKIYRDIGSFPNTFTLQTEVYHDDVGARSDIDYYIAKCRQSDESFYPYFASNGLFIRDTDSGYTEVGTNLVKEDGSAEDQIWRFLITFTGTTGDGTCDVYLKDSAHNWSKVGTSINCSYETAGTEGLVELTQTGYANDNMVTHVKYIKIATGLYIP